MVYSHVHVLMATVYRARLSNFYETTGLLTNVTRCQRGVLLQCHTARLIGDCNHWILCQTSLLH